MKLYLPGGAAVTLGRSDFVASGGQGSVYARGDRAYKVYADPTAAVPPGKLQDLAVLAHPDILRPLEPLLDRQGAQVGHTLRFVPDTEVLCTLFARAFRDQQGITPAIALALCDRLRTLVDAAHAASCLVVDLNEMNFLVSRRWKRVFAIDVDGWQTPRFPATALMDSVRDRHGPPGRFDRGTDWFAFAVTAFQLLRGVHPYKGLHPDVQGLDARMTANLSVLDPSVTAPPVIQPVDVVPPALQRWFHEVLQEGARSAPPTATGSLPSRPPAPRPAASTPHLEVRTLATFDATVRLWVAHRGRVVAIAGDRVFVDGRPQPLPHPTATVGFSPRGNRPVLAWVEGGRLRLFDLLDRRPIPCDLAASRVVSSRARLQILSGTQVLEMGFVEGASLLPAPRPLVQVLPRATSLHPGCALQDLLGARWLSAFAGPGLAHQVRLPAFDRARVLHARCDRGVLVVVAAGPSGPRRHVLRFAADHRTWDLRSADAGPGTAEVVVLDSGVALSVDEQGRLELFSARPGDPRLQLIDLPGLADGMHLCDGGGTVVAVRGREVLRLGMR